MGFAMIKPCKDPRWLGYAILSTIWLFVCFHSVKHHCWIRYLANQIVDRMPKCFPVLISTYLCHFNWHIFMKCFHQVRILTFASMTHLVSTGELQVSTTRCCPSILRELRTKCCHLARITNKVLPSGENLQTLYFHLVGVINKAFCFHPS